MNDWFFFQTIKMNKEKRKFEQVWVVSGRSKIVMEELYWAVYDE
jgi:hypothetical protein